MGIEREYRMEKLILNLYFVNYFKEYYKKKQ